MSAGEQQVDIVVARLDKRDAMRLQQKFEALGGQADGFATCCEQARGCHAIERVDQSGSGDQFEKIPRRADLVALERALRREGGEDDCLVVAVLPYGLRKFDAQTVSAQLGIENHQIELAGMPSVEKGLGSGECLDGRLRALVGSPARADVAQVGTFRL